MLMMLVCSPADAHDAGVVVSGVGPRRAPADAHDAGVFGGLGPRRAPADAHDAGVFRGWGLGVLQLMLMMLVCFGGGA